MRLRRNSPLSQYSRGYVFYNFTDMPDTDAKRVRDNLLAMLVFDSVSFSPLVAMVDKVYKEKSLEEKLTGIMNRHELGRASGKSKLVIGSEVRTGQGPVIISG